VISTADEDRCRRIEEVPLYALRALPPTDAQIMESHIASCEACRQRWTELRPVIDSLRAWPVDVARPSASLWDKLLARIATVEDNEAGKAPTKQWFEPAWEDVASGISCKLLSNDPQGDRVSMLVRLGPGVEYPPHRHAGIEELYLLQGELWIGNKKLYPGDYNRAEPGTIDTRVWSESGCTCLLITSPSDRLDLFGAAS
jgi:anti-sigma factor ChrR (cupin superfamily)